MPLFPSLSKRHNFIHVKLVANTPIHTNCMHTSADKWTQICNSDRGFVQYWQNVLRSNRHGSITCHFSASSLSPGLGTCGTSSGEKNQVAASYDISFACKSNSELRDYPNNCLGNSKEKVLKTTENYKQIKIWNKLQMQVNKTSIKKAKHLMLVPRIIIRLLSACLSRLCPIMQRSWALTCHTGNLQGDCSPSKRLSFTFMRQLPAVSFVQWIVWSCCPFTFGPVHIQKE